MVQWLRLHAFNTEGEGAGLIPGWGTNYHKLHDMAKKKKKGQTLGDCTCSVEFSVEVKTSHARADLNHLYNLIFFN